MKIYQLFLLYCLAVLSTSEIAAQSFIKAGIWRGEFRANETKIPFNFEITSVKSQTAKVALLNGTRRDDFTIQLQNKDSIIIKLDIYDAVLLAKIDADNKLSGVYRSLTATSNIDLPFTAEAGKSYRFVKQDKTVASKTNLNGKWRFQFDSKDADRIAIIEQNGNKLTGIIMSITGDSRALEGNIQADSFYLSGFTGSRPNYIRGKIHNEKEITGAIGLDASRAQKFTALKEETAELPDPYALTYLKPGFEKLDFTLPDLDGNLVSLSDDKYKGKVVIVEILGSWCPNCMDQTKFLAPWYSKNKQRDVAVIGIGFERKDDLEFAKRTLGRLKTAYNIEYDLLFGGIADKKVAAEKLPALNQVLAFPTKIIIDRKGKVRKIYTGFTSETTGKYYEDYVAKFNKLVDELLAEPNPFANNVNSKSERKK